MRRGAIEWTFIGWNDAGLNLLPARQRPDQDQDADTRPISSRRRARSDRDQNVVAERIRRLAFRALPSLFHDGQTQSNTSAIERAVAIANIANCAGPSPLLGSNPTLGHLTDWPSVAETGWLGRKVFAVRLHTMQAVAWAVFSASLLLVSCHKGGSGLSAPRDGSIEASADSAVGSGGSGQGGLSGLGGVTGSGGIVLSGSGGLPTGYGGSSQAGMSGSGGTGGVSTHTIGADGLLDTGATQDLVVARDEHHVAFMRDYLPQPSCSQTGEPFNIRARQVGTLLVATIADDGTVVVRVVGQSVKLDSVGFSADSKSMAYVDGYDACALGGILKTAAADGTNPRTIESVPTNFDEQIEGNTLLFLSPGPAASYGRVFGVWLPIGAPILIPVVSNAYYTGYHTGIWMSPDGRLAGYFDTTGAAIVLDVTTGTSHQVALGANAESYDTFLWSDDGGFFALENLSAGMQQSGFAVATAGGTQATHFASSGLAPSPVFSPDSSMLAYQALDGAGVPEIVVHFLAGGTADVYLQGLPDPANNYFDVSFSPDSALALILATDSTSSARSLYTAPVNASGPVQLITSHVSDTLLVPAAPPGDSNLAVALESAYTEVFSFNGADSNLLPGDSPVYEPNSAQPRLLLYPLSQGSRADPVPAFLLASTDGTSMKTVLLPTGASLWGPVPQWMGHTVISGFSPALTGAFLAIYASSGDSASPTLLAAGPDTYAWAPIPVPTRLFYARVAASSAGSAGLWMAHLP
jgi:hypothetical protein